MNVCKITPVSVYDVRGLESWLEDMARRGLFLKRLRPAFSTFQRGPAQPLRYRVEPCRRIMDDTPPQAMLDLYQDFGWHFVCDANSELLVFSTQDPEAPEPHSDPELQGALWKKLYRSKRRGFLFILAVTLAFLVLLPVFLFGKGAPTLTLLTTTAPILIIYLVFFLVTLPGYWAEAQRLGLIVKQLEEGVPLDHRSAYPRRRWSEIATLVTTLVLFAAVITVQNILPLTGGGVRPLEDLTAFPALSLAEVEGEGYVPDIFVMEGRDYANFCEPSHYLLCWNQWDVVQTGDIEPEGWVRMEINWYDLPAPLSFLSAPLARELLDSAMGLDQDIWWTDNAGAAWTVEYTPHLEAGFLAAARREDGGFQVAAVSMGDRAAVVRYTGRGSLTDHLDEIVDMVKGGA
ncbi:MAG: DUF2812 domain-containing protein [Lawsonibacter sp.]|jgi:hypothetical protein|nr:DUF2812 domain-containing protein [Lawsonibacter sp.]